MQVLYPSVTGHFGAQMLMGALPVLWQHEGGAWRQSFLLVHSAEDDRFEGFRFCLAKEV